MSGFCQPPSAQLLFFPGSQGPAGPQGPIGPQGSQGIQGQQGIQGVQGPQGVSGVAAACRVHRNADQLIANTVETGILWQAADYDDASMFNGIDPQYLFPPAGASRVRLTAGVRWEASALGTYRTVRLRGLNPAGYYNQNVILACDNRAPDGAAGASASCTLTTGIVLVQNIEKFELTVQQDSGTGLLIWGANGTEPGRGWATFFNMEVMP